MIVRFCFTETKIYKEELLLLNLKIYFFSNKVPKKESLNTLILTRKYCDVCEMFDTHDTKDCLTKRDEELEIKRHNVISPLTPFSISGNTMRKNKLQRRAYCDECEEFGHETFDCLNK